MNNNAQDAFDRLKRLWDLLSLPECRDRDVTKARKELAARSVAFLKQSIPQQISQQRARSEIPILAAWLVSYFSPSVHGRYQNGRSGIKGSVAKSLSRIEATLREEYLPRTEQEQLDRQKTDAKRSRKE